MKNEKEEFYEELRATIKNTDCDYKQAVFNTMMKLHPHSAERYRGAESIAFYGIDDAQVFIDVCLAPIINYDQFIEKYEEEFQIEFAESGADRELDFNEEKEMEDRYEEYLIKILFVEKYGPGAIDIIYKQD